MQYITDLFDDSDHLPFSGHLEPLLLQTELLDMVQHKDHPAYIHHLPKSDVFIINNIVDTFTRHLPPQIQRNIQSVDFVMLRNASGTRVISARAVPAPRTSPSDIPSWNLTKTVKHVQPADVHYTGNWHFDEEGELQSETRRTVMFSAILWPEENRSRGTEMFTGDRIRSSQLNIQNVFVPDSDNKQNLDEPSTTRESINGEIVPVSYVYHRGPYDLKPNESSSRFTIQIGYTFHNALCTITNSQTRENVTLLHPCLLRF